MKHKFVVRTHFLENFFQRNFQFLSRYLRNQFDYEVIQPSFLFPELNQENRNWQIRKHPLIEFELNWIKTFGVSFLIMENSL